MSRIREIVETWAINIANSVALIASWGKRVLHEGRYRNGVWSDWARRFHCRPRHYETPATEEELAAIVAAAGKVRVVGAGHSFNAAPLSDATLISLDKLDAVEVRDHPDADKPGWKVASIQTGIRLRDLNDVLRDQHGLSLSVAGSTDAQSIGGLIATDIHGTGRDHGFLSEAARSLRIVAADGTIATFHPGDDVFHAAFGAMGTCGVVVGAEIDCEPAYQLATAIRVVERRWAEDNIDQLLRENTHLSFYYFGGLAHDTGQDEEPGLAKVRMNKWNRTVEPPGTWLWTRKLIGELLDMGFSGFALGIARALHLTYPTAKLGIELYSVAVNQNVVVYPSAMGFARKLYFRHDEIEYGVPYESYKACLDEVRALLLERKYPTVIEIRFTPNNSQALLAPGAGRRTAYIELAPSMSQPTDPIFREFEQILLKHGGQVHLGKKTWVTRQDLERMYPAELLRRFDAARRSQDPEGKFMNEFTRTILGP